MPMHSSVVGIQNQNSNFQENDGHGGLKNIQSSNWQDLYISLQGRVPMEDDMCPPLPSSVSSTNSASPELDNFSLHFASMYHSIFPPLLSSSSLSFTPSPSSSADDDLIHRHHTDDLLFQARIVLEHRELCQRLHRVTDDIECLRRENAELRLANADLVKVLSSKTAVDDLLVIPNSHLLSLMGGEGQNGEEVGNNYEIISPTSVIGKFNNQFDRRNYRRRISLPKTISVRSAAAPLNIQSRRVCAPVSGGESGKKDQEEAMELEVYNQGMAKTELCNKWRDTGACPYGDHCRFSHGLEELRPVMRHPRYKTEMCRMILNGEKCPYGHRCHFRHSLTGR